MLLIAAIVILNPVTGLAFWFLNEGGTFTRWASLGTPPETPTGILAADVRNVGVFVRTASGQIYQYYQNGNSNTWIKRSENEVRGYNFPDCLMGKPDGGKHLRTEIDNYPVYWCGEFDYGRAYYAIREDGSVWVWKRSGSFPDWAIHLCVYTSAGVIVCVALFVLIRVTTKRIKNL